MTEEAHVINSGAASGEGGARRPPSDLAKQLQKTMLAIKGSFISADGKGVDYASIAGSELFQAYVSLASELRNCDPSSLEENERKAFFISILNAPHWVGLMCVCPEQCNGHPYSRNYAHTHPHTHVHTYCTLLRSAAIMISNRPTSVAHFYWLGIP